MTAQPHEIEAWLGGSVDELPADRRKVLVDRLIAEDAAITAAYPDPDDHRREAAFTAAAMYLLGDLTLDQAAAARGAARREESRAVAVSLQLAAMASADGMPDATAARTAGIDRQSLLKRLGKKC